MTSQHNNVLGERRTKNWDMEEQKINKLTKQGETMQIRVKIFRETAKRRDRLQLEVEELKKQKQNSFLIPNYVNCFERSLSYDNVHPILE